MFALFDENLGFEERSAMAKQLAKTLVPSSFSLGKPKDPSHSSKRIRKDINTEELWRN